MSALKLPRDLAAFLRQGRQFDYDPARCEAGLVTLLPLDVLRLHLFPMDCQSTPVAKADPNHGSLGCYLVPGVSLLAPARGYDPDGLMLWLPLERRFGTWDSSHDVVSMYKRGTTWADIVAQPKQHINACWGSWKVMECLKPWLRCRYYPSMQIHSPIIPVATESDEGFRLLSYQAVYHEREGGCDGKVIGFEDVTATSPTKGEVCRQLRDLLAAAVAERLASDQPLPEPRLADLHDDGPFTRRRMMPVALEPRRE